MTEGEAKGLSPIVPRYDGRIYPTFDEFVKDPAAKLQSIKAMECREDDVILCNYPKSGTNWYYNMLNMLINRKPEYTTRQSLRMFIDLAPVSDVDQESSPRVIFTHMPFALLPSQCMEKKIKIIHVRRNPHDVYVSLFCHLYKDAMFTDTPWLKDWDSFITAVMNEEFCLYGGWFQHEKEFEEAQKKYPDQVMIVSFEETKQDTENTLQKVADFLGIDASEQLLQQIALKTEFKTMKDAATNMKHDYIDIIYRKGEIGDWKNWFTVAQAECFEECLKRYNINFGY